MHIILILALINCSYAAMNVSFLHSPSDDDLDYITKIDHFLFLSTEDDDILKSVDNGKTWVNTRTFNADGSMRCIKKTPEGIYLACGGEWGDYCIQVSRDSGSTWKTIWTDDDNNLTEIVIPDTGSAYVFGDEEDFLHVSANYSKIRKMKTPWGKKNVYTTVSIDETHILFAGSEGFTAQYDNLLQKKYYINARINNNRNITRVRLGKNRDIVASLEDGRMLLSQDEGRTWSTVHAGIKHITDFCINEGGVGLAVGHYGLVLVTLDYGYTWKTVPTYSKASFNSVVEIDIGHWLLAGDEGTLVGIDF